MEKAFYLSNDPVQRAARISTGEDVFIHEQAPDKIFVLPNGADARDLEEEDAIVIEEVIHLA